MKIIMVIVMVLFAAIFAPLSSWILSSLQSDPKAKLAVVMVLTPLLMNALQLWVTYNFLKKSDDEADLGLSQARELGSTELPTLADTDDGRVGSPVQGSPV